MRLTISEQNCIKMLRDYGKVFELADELTKFTYLFVKCT